jgi:hypothetical protein
MPSWFMGVSCFAVSFSVDELLRCTTLGQVSRLSSGHGCSDVRDSSGRCLARDAQP